jgi:hypothetical protein
MLSETEKNDILTNIENDINYILSYYKTQIMWIKKYKSKLDSYEIKIHKTKTEKLKHNYENNIQYCKTKIENHQETIIIMSNYY